MFFLADAVGDIAPINLNLDITEICLRLLCAMVVGLVIGIEREYTHRPAGMRTHILVALGSCAVMLTGQLLFAEYNQFNATPDPARLAAQVISGVGFLGAGTILREGANVKGLTTAASLWAVACLGITVGAGYYWVAGVGTVFIFLTLTVFELLQNVLMRLHSQTRDYVVDATDVAEALQVINTQAEAVKCELKHIQAENLPDGSCRISFRADYGHGRVKARRQGFFMALSKSPVVKVVHATDEKVGVK